MNTLFLIFIIFVFLLFFRNIFFIIKNYKKKEIRIETNEDEIVKNASFSQCKIGWKNFKTHKLITDNKWNFIFKATPFSSKLFLFMTTILSILFLTSIYTWIRHSQIPDVLIWQLIFWAFLWLFYFRNNHSKIFDFQNGYFYDLKYRKNLEELIKNDENYSKYIIPINKIHALQIIWESILFWRKWHIPYVSYELNAILKNSDRINIIDHKKLRIIQEEAQQLADKLWVKIYQQI